MFGRNDERIVYSDANVAETAPSLGGPVLGAAMPEIGLLRSGIRNHKGRVLLILGGTAVLGVALLLAISWLNGKDAKGGRAGAAKFATALVHNQPSLAGDGAAGYVAGVRAHFGPVSSTKVIAGHERGVNSRYSADERTYYVVDMLIQSKLGPAALELDFDDGAIGSQRISSVQELPPSDTPAISPAQRNQLEKAFAARGGKAADEVTLSSTAPTTIVSTPAVKTTNHPAMKVPKVPVVPKAASDQLNKATKQLSCVQNAHGDVTKIQACTQP
jgi:hypothetical protein